MTSSTWTEPVLQGELLQPSVPAIPYRRLRFKHVTVALLLSLIFVIAFAFLALHGYIAWVLSNPTVATITSNPYMAKRLQYETVAFPALDHSTNLDGWYIPAANSKKTIVFSHGYGANREELWVPMYDLAQFAHRLNYNVVMFDYGFASTTHKLAATGGAIESQQLLGAVDYAKQRGAKEVVVWGFSMGAGTALQAALKTDDINAMILDSTFLLEPDTLYHNISQHIQLPRDVSLPILRSLFPVINGTSLKQIPYEEVKQHDYKMPIFFIHGTNDEKAPYPIAEHLASNQSNAASEVWISNGSLHEMIYRQHSKEYLKRTAAFLNEAL
ncbi:alpha/beta hydrolase [Paenibacillus selenitireducens]|jgi:pimeloyl-ACP methyl ester carboxylesterase|uniref:Alpha/beta hydrolase n=1 Tax=Paenibacillus selenitireducens TaxID=1324314 RepID=A0A1T2X6N7_9BACL|nr:alpha/beta fold hydrolase [Paenibacillus selenitireducens]OPA75551.1 alpha/beta hydrolase [Paenibacillus selenitireducens]